jgi:hypothetical protein
MGWPLQVAALLAELAEQRRQQGGAQRQWQRRMARAVEQHQAEAAVARQRLEHALGAWGACARFCRGERLNCLAAHDANGGVPLNA